MFTQTEATMFFNCISSQDAAHQFLLQSYNNLKLADAEIKAYSNAQAFLYYITYGRDLFAQGHTLPKATQPLLFFYGAAHLIKACLLSVCPNYPEQTSQLAHGVSARKRKKKDFTFITDEVKIQQQGLFPCLAEHLFNISHFSETKIKMHNLLTSIPELLPIMSNSPPTGLAAVGSAMGKRLFLPNEIRDGHQATWKTIARRIRPLFPQSLDITEQKEGLQLNVQGNVGLLHGPMFVTDMEGVIYVHLDKNPATAMSELMIHYLLLYNLSMLSRYETEWWGDLFALRENIDYPAISVFLDISVEKFPWLISSWLQRQNRKNPGTTEHRD